MRNIKFFLVSILCLSLLLAGCGDLGKLIPLPGFLPEQETEATATQAPELEPTVQAPEQEEIQPVYVLKTVYLCTGDILTNYEDDSSFANAYTYDEFGRLFEAWRVKPDGTKELTSTYFYDEFGNNVLLENKNSRYEMEYDEQGRLVAKCWFSDDVCKSEYLYVYDDAGFVIQRVEISRYSEETVTVYNVQYNEDHTYAYVEKLTDEEFAGYTEETYNENGQVLTSKNYDADGAWRSTLTYEYDEFDRLAVEYHFSRSETQADYDVIYSYDERGLMVSKNVDYYYGYLQEYTYEAFEILVPMEQ